jgi:hypothetical protein
MKGRAVRPRTAEVAGYDMPEAMDRTICSARFNVRSRSGELFAIGRPYGSFGAPIEVFSCRNTGVLKGQVRSRRSVMC